MGSDVTETQPEFPPYSLPPSFARISWPTLETPRLLPLSPNAPRGPLRSPGEPASPLALDDPSLAEEVEKVLSALRERGIISS